MIYSLLIFSYLMIALATPTDVDYLMYAFIVQMGSGIGILLSSLQFCMFFPARQSLLVGSANTFMAVSSIVPQIWLISMEKTGISLTHLMIIWMCLASVSLVVGVLLFPWHNLPDDGCIEERHLATIRKGFLKIPLLNIIRKLIKKPLLPAPYERTTKPYFELVVSIPQLPTSSQKLLRF